MIATDRVRLAPHSANFVELELVGDRVSRLWNACNYVCRQSFFAKTGVATGYRLEALVKQTPQYRQ